MKILSHRGFWFDPQERNSSLAFHRSLDNCFGIETDIRDDNGKVVISHDMPTRPVGTLLDFFDRVEAYSCCQDLIFALNIKSDGLAKTIKPLIQKYNNLDCFFFDMSIPDMREYLQLEIPVFTRISEVEQSPVWLEKSAGVWLDCFNSEWYDLSLIIDLLSQEKRVCIVSPELHGRPYKSQWSKLRKIDHQDLMLCTDLPGKAEVFFNKKGVNFEKN